jgi:hypothetical protein
VQDHRAALYLKQRFARQAARKVARWNDCDDRGILDRKARVIHGTTKYQKSREP